MPLSILNTLSTHTSYTPFKPTHADHINIALISSGYENYTQEDIYSWNGLDACRSKKIIWQYTVSGCGKLNYEGIEYDLPTGTAMLLHVPSNYHYYLPQNSENWSFIYLTFVGKEALFLGKKLQTMIGIVNSFSHDSIVVQTALSMIVARSRKNIADFYFESSQAYHFFMTLFSEFANTSTSPELYFEEKVYRYCMIHMDKSITVNQLADMLEMSRSHFSRLFHASLNITPSDYITKIKMEHATHLLRCTDASIKEIGQQCGYENTSYFCKTFKRFYSSTPHEFRLTINTH